MDRIVFNELDQGSLMERSRAVLLDIIDGMHAQGAQGKFLPAPQFRC